MRILYACLRTPYPADRGDRIRNLQAIKALSRRHDVTLVCLEEPGSADALKALRRWVSDVHTVRHEVLPMAWKGISSLLHGVPLHVGFYNSSRFRHQVSTLARTGSFDLVYANLLRMVPVITDHVVPIVLDLTDSLALNYETRAKLGQGLRGMYWRYEAVTTARYERLATQTFKHLLVCSEADREYMVRNNPLCNPYVVPNGVDTDYFSESSERRSGAEIVFTGTMNYFPNEDAAVVLASHILPTVRTALPWCCLSIVGRDPSPIVRNLANQPGVTVTGAVPDVRPYLHRGRVFAAPMRAGSGTQNKILEALATGLPVVTTTDVARALRLGPEHGLIATNDWSEFAHSIVRLCKDDVWFDEMSRRARESVLRLYSLAAVEKSLLDVVDHACARDSKNPGGCS